MKSFEIFEHTADVGLRIFGKDLKSLFENAARGLFSQITDDNTPQAPSESHPLELQTENPDDLFLVWLRELLFLFDTKKIIFTEFDFIDISERSLKANLKGYVFDPAIHNQKTEVKAVTYHGFKMEQKPDGWIAEVILDI